MNMKLWVLVGFLSLASVAQPTLYGWEGGEEPSTEGWILTELDIPKSLQLFPLDWVLHFHRVAELEALPESTDDAPAFAYVTSDETLWVKNKQDNTYQQLTFEVCMATCGDLPAKPMRVLTGREHLDVIFDYYTLVRDVVKLSFIQKTFEGLLASLTPDFLAAREAASAHPTGWHLLGVDTAKAAGMSPELAFDRVKFKCLEDLPVFLNPLHDKDLPACVRLTTDGTFWVKHICEPRYVKLALEERTLEDGSVVLIVAEGEHAHAGKIVCDCDTQPTSAQNDFVKARLVEMFVRLSARRK